MKKRLFSLLLALCLLVGSASALTAEQTKEILKAYYIDEVSEEVLAQPTIEAILEALGDPYTSYFSAEEYAAFLASMEDTHLVGIGIVAQYLPAGVLLIQVADSSPASEAGLQSGDYIVAIDGNDTRGAEADDIDSWIRGEEGTQVELTVLRNEESFTVTATRGQVVFPTVTLDKVENRVGWITCSAFGSTTFQHFYDIITAYDDEVDQWVVDLRENGGGDVNAAVLSAGCFAGWKQGVYLRDGNGTYYRCLSDPDLITALGYSDSLLSAYDPNGYLTFDPVYVLTSEYTASASELFCAAIRDSGAGLIIGGRTYGKGVAQTLFSKNYFLDWMAGYFDGGDALKVTTERSFSTAGATYDKVGILPHFLVDSSLADEVAALLAAPASPTQDALILSGLSSSSQLLDSVALPLTALQDPANAAAVKALLSALPATASCQLRQNGSRTNITTAQAAQQCNVSLDQRTFTDAAGSRFSTEINTLGTYGIVNGFGDSTFRPSETLTRAQLCVLLANAMQLPLTTGESAFADVQADDWFAPYVNTLSDMGMVNGYDDGLFRPNEPINHEQFLTLLGRVGQWLDRDLYELARHDGIYGDFLPDAQTLAWSYPSYSDWAREMVWLCSKGLTWDNINYVSPTAATSREEAAASLFNLLVASGVLSG